MPISNCPLFGVALRPVPPNITGKAFARERFVKNPVEAEKLPLTPKFPVKVSVVFFKGVYPRADVMSDDDKEKDVVRFDNPSLVKVRVLMVEAESENEIPVT